MTLWCSVLSAAFFLPERFIKKTTTAAPVGCLSSSLCLRVRSLPTRGVCLSAIVEEKKEGYTGMGGRHAQWGRRAAQSRQ
mmetsp:Transcript_20196/g.65053  ORF Transcript_20196/g.65053 Transcript_20196/m.65053 type:complete len:80 (+) Transcript_20196:1033-1272(+)